MKNLEQVQKILKENQDELRKKYHIKSLGVFGSVARGDSTETSDIDLLVEFSEAPNMFKFIELENHLSSLVGKKVDLVTKKALKPAIKDEILQEVVYI